MRMEIKGPERVGRRLVYRMGKPPCELDVYDQGDGKHFIGYRWLATNPEVLLVERRKREFYEKL